jgi:hypothetical protein
VDLVQEGLEALVLGQPGADLREDLLGDVDGASLAGLLEGEVLAGVPGAAVVAAAGRAAAAAGAGAERGGPDGGRGPQLLEAVLEQAEEGGGVVGDGQGASGTKGRGDQRA